MILSRQNPLIKRIRALKDKKVRDTQQEYVIESPKLVIDAISQNQPIDIVVCTVKGLNYLDGKLDVLKTETVEDSVFESISTEVTPQGVLAILKKPSLTPVPPTSSCILLDGVSDPANVGAILRTASASGYSEIYIKNSADPFSPKSVRASMGGIFRCKVYDVSSLDVFDVIDYPLIVADMFGENVFEFNSPTKFCLVIGNEGNGVSEQVKSKAKYTVKIPMQNDVESLNASVSAGILMYRLKNKL